MRFYFYSPVTFEKWDFRNPDAKGIGGSEVSHIEMAWRLARRGHEVISYAPIPDDCPKEDRGVTWKKLDEADFKEQGVWILYRCPQILDKFSPLDDSQTRWLICQDTGYFALTKQRVDKLNRVVALCSAHVEHLKSSWPFLADKLWISSNGVRCDLIRKVERNNIPRNPNKIVYASSPDRGLLTLLKIFRKAREYTPELELHVFYGFDNINKILKGDHFAQKVKREVEYELKQKGVVWRGRVGQEELYREWLSAGLWVYPTDFTETSCITGMEAMCMGAFPITRPLWALKDNIKFGIAIEGYPASDPLVQSRYAGEITRAIRTGLPEKHRADMMKSSRFLFNWDRYVDQWEMDLLGIDQCFTQYAFQHKHAQGRILNVGCDSDESNFWKRGAVNLDVCETSPVTKIQNQADIIHDARLPLPECLGKFDTVIVGDLLEHATVNDGIAILKNCKEVMKPDGRLIVTAPDDFNRSALVQHQNLYGNEEYVSGVSAFHHRHVSKEQLQDQLAKGGFEPTLYQEIDYTTCDGHGFVAKGSE